LDVPPTLPLTGLSDTRRLIYSGASAHTPPSPSLPPTGRSTSPRLRSPSRDPGNTAAGPRAFGPLVGDTSGGRAAVPPHPIALCGRRRSAATISRHRRPSPRIARPRFFWFARRSIREPTAAISDRLRCSCCNSPPVIGDAIDDGAGGRERGLTRPVLRPLTDDINSRPIIHNAASSGKSRLSLLTALLGAELTSKKIAASRCLRPFEYNLTLAPVRPKSFCNYDPSITNPTINTNL
jgi:hypothetical protein